MTAERRAKAFTAGTVNGAVSRGAGDEAARFYAAEGAKVLQAYFHAAALAGLTVEDVLRWIADPHNAGQPEEILRTDPSAAPFWDGLLRGALHGDDRTAGNTITTVQQSMALFFQESIRRRCTPGHGRPATDIADMIKRGGTVFLLGRDDPYASASPLMTAIAEHVLDTALGLAMRSPYGRLCPPFLACLDELPSTTPLPTLRTRMANERALGLSFIYAAQTWRQLVICYGEDEARTMFGLTNNLVNFGGGKDVEFYKEVSELLGTTRIVRRSYNHSRSGWSSSLYGEDVPILRPRRSVSCPTDMRSSSQRTPGHSWRDCRGASTARLVDGCLVTKQPRGRPHRRPGVRRDVSPSHGGAFPCAVARDRADPRGASGRRGGCACRIPVHVMRRLNIRGGCHRVDHGVA
jgi:type IV secretion system protein VirD4